MSIIVYDLVSALKILQHKVTRQLQFWAMHHIFSCSMDFGELSYWKSPLLILLCSKLNKADYNLYRPWTHFYTFLININLIIKWLQLKPKFKSPRMHDAIDIKIGFMNIYTDFHIWLNEHFDSLIQTDLFFTFLSWISRLADFWFPWQVYFDPPFALTTIKTGFDECHPIVLLLSFSTNSGSI